MTNEQIDQIIEDCIKSIPDPAAKEFARTQCEYRVFSSRDFMLTLNPKREKWTILINDERDAVSINNALSQSIARAMVGDSGDKERDDQKARDLFATWGLQQRWAIESERGERVRI